MLDEKKIRLMTQMARYENGAGKEDLRITRFYRSDYIALGLLKNFLFTTLGYFLVWGVIIADHMEYLLANLHKVKISAVVGEFIIGYLVFLIIYSAVTYRKRYRRYGEAKKNVKRYYTGLERLSRTYYGEAEETLRSAGGKNL